MLKFQTIILIISLALSYGCSRIPKIDQALPDKRTEYQKSKDLPALEIPPDLTVTEGEYQATIPGEAESMTLSEFERQRDQREKRGNIVLGSGEAEDERWLALKGATESIWPQLREFWEENGYIPELDDAELGVLETDWKEDDIARNKFRVLAEDDEQGGVILFISSEHEQLSEGVWLEAAVDKTLEKEILRQLNLHFYGDVVDADVDDDGAMADTASSDAVPVQPRPQAELINTDDGMDYLFIPEEFTRVWEKMETMIQAAGYTVETKDQENGIYHFLYLIPEEEKGLFSKLKFWGDDEDDGIPYQLGLTVAGDNTEVIVMTADGERETGETASKILARLRETYNQF